MGPRKHEYIGKGSSPIAFSIFFQFLTKIMEGAYQYQKLVQVGIGALVYVSILLESTSLFILNEVTQYRFLLFKIFIIN